MSPLRGIIRATLVVALAAAILLASLLLVTAVALATASVDAAVRSGAIKEGGVAEGRAVSSVAHPSAAKAYWGGLAPVDAANSEAVATAAHTTSGETAAGAMASDVSGGGALDGFASDVDRAVVVDVVSVPALASGPLVADGSSSTTQRGQPQVFDPPSRRFYANDFPRRPSVESMTALGRSMFRDPSLSASGRTACATCHSPAHAFGASNDAAVQRAGADGRQAGVRAVPSLMYLQNVPAFTEHYVDDEGDDSVDQGPAGGRTWDGRAQSAHDQAQLPLFSLFEMANTGVESVVAKVEHSTYANQFRAAFGERVFEDRALAFKGVLMALETYQQSPSEFYPYTSKYDAWLRNQASFTSAEARGMAAFNDPAKGNCARCHPSAVREGAFPQFTDFGYAAIGAPRNPNIPANSNGRYHDLGLCGPLRTDLEDKKEYCGLFRTPSLRNVALRRVFLHNGVFERLEDVVRFYAERDTAPQKWYPVAADGKVRKFDDLPEKYQANVDREAPFGRHAGDRPALTDRDITDIVAFLGTLTDGYSSKSARR